MEEQIKQLDLKIESAKSDDNIQETEIAELIFDKGVIYKIHKEKESALKEFKEVIATTRSFNLKVNAVFEILHVGIIYKDLTLLKDNIELCHSFLKDGGDWEKRNRLRIYEGLYCMLTKEFKETGKLFLDALMTFTTYELMDYKTFVFYTALCNIISVDRNTLKNKVIDNSDVVACINDIPYLQEFLDSFYEGRYNDFFQIFVKVCERTKNDEFMSKHNNHFVMEMRIKVYSQFLRKYCSV